jgi:hypothetical protein
MHPFYKTARVETGQGSSGTATYYEEVLLILGLSLLSAADKKDHSSKYLTV